MARYRFDLGTRKFTYIVGNHTVAIIPPSGKWHTAPLGAVQTEEYSGNRIQNGTADGRIAVEEVAAYVLRLDLR